MISWYARTVGPFDDGTLPAALLTTHLVPERCWGELQVFEGSVIFSMATVPPWRRWLTSGDRQAIPPGIAHHLILEGAVVLAINSGFEGERPRVSLKEERRLMSNGAALGRDRVFDYSG